MVCCDGGQQLGSLVKKLSEGHFCRAAYKGEVGHALPKNLLELSTTECKAAFIHIVEQAVGSSRPTFRKKR